MSDILVSYNELELKLLDQGQLPNNQSIKESNRVAGLVSLLSDFFGNEAQSSETQPPGLSYCPDFGCMQGIQEDSPGFTLPLLTIWESRKDFNNFMKGRHRELVSSLLNYCEDNNINLAKPQSAIFEAKLPLGQEISEAIAEGTDIFHDPLGEKLMEIAQEKIKASNT